MDNNKSIKILNTATKVFGEKGYQYSSISTIAKEAGISTGLVYSYYINKLDLLLSIIIKFLEEVDSRIEKLLNEFSNPQEKLIAIITLLEEVLIQNNTSVYVLKISNESVPDIKLIKEPKLKEKRKRITELNSKFNKIIDSIIDDGQKNGLFYNTNNPSLIRQILMGAFEKIVLDLIFKENVTQKYIEDIQMTIKRLYNKFICNN